MGQHPPATASAPEWPAHSGQNGQDRDLGEAMALSLLLLLLWVSGKERPGEGCRWPRGGPHYEGSSLTSLGLEWEQGMY